MSLHIWIFVCLQKRTLQTRGLGRFPYISIQNLGHKIGYMSKIMRTQNLGVSWWRSTSRATMRMYIYSKSMIYFSECRIFCFAYILTQMQIHENRTFSALLQRITVWYKILFLYLNGDNSANIRQAITIYIFSAGILFRTKL